MSFTTGKHTYIDGDKIEINSWGIGKLTIGSFCSIAKGLTVFLAGNHRIDWITTYPFDTFYNKWTTNLEKRSQNNIGKGDVIIGNDVWIGQGVTIMSGVTIGDGAVIGAKTVVTKDVPPYSLCVGNPGVIKKYRFTEEQREQLLKIKWWTWEDEKINEYKDLLCSRSIDKFISLCIDTEDESLESIGNVEALSRIKI